jgi:uncharacterized membrane protein YccF (DUF307 family)
MTDTPTDGSNSDDGRPATHRRGQSRGLLVRAVYFLLVGWWASGIWLGVAWFLCVTIVGLPLGIKMINRVPLIVSLKDREVETAITRDDDGHVSITESGPEQYSLAVRAAYFLLVGWWASGVWLSIAWLASITVVGLPVAVWLYSRLPFVVSLYRY